MIIRPARADDVSALVTLLRRSWLKTFAADLPFEAVQEFARSDPARAYAEAMWADFDVAVLEQRIAGMCHIVGNLVAAIHVDPLLKGQGIGAALMDSAEARIATGGFTEARLEVLVFNRDAQGFYAHRGWNQAGAGISNECGIEIDTIIMTKPCARASAPRLP